MANKDTEGFDKLKNTGYFIILFLMFLDIYAYYYASLSFIQHPILDRMVLGLTKAGLFNTPFYPRYIILLLSILFILFDTGKKNVEIDRRTAIFQGIISTVTFIATAAMVMLKVPVIIYVSFYLGTFLYIIKSYSVLHRLFTSNLMKDRFNKRNKIFDQTTELIENELSINVPYQFVEKYKETKGQFTPVYSKGYINIVAPNRAVLIMGLPGSGKSYSWVEEIIKQHIKKGFAMVNYDFKFPTLSNLAYDYYKTYKSAYDKYENGCRFATVNIDDPRYSNRCNPVKPDLIPTKAEAIDAVNTIFFNIDKKSATKQDFFQMSAMAVTSATLWFLKMYENGKYCSLPHLIEFIQHPDEKILTILDSYPELRYFVASFKDALNKEAFDQLAGQTASARIPLGKLATDQLFYVMTDPEGTGVDLAVNREEKVTILNIANNPKTKLSNAPALGLYMSQAAKLVNAQNRVPVCFQVDELPTIFINGLDDLIATGRSNKVCTILSIQDYTQMVRDYGKEIADSIYNTASTKLTGQVAPDTADKVSKNIGKINYKQQSVTVNKDSTSTQFSTQREFAVPAEDIAQFSQGEFAGILSDTFKEPLPIKIFRGQVSPDKSDQKGREVPMINPDLDEHKLRRYRIQIQEEVAELIEIEMARIESEKHSDIDILVDSQVNVEDENFNPEEDPNSSGGTTSQEIQLDAQQNFQKVSEENIFNELFNDALELEVNQNLISSAIDLQEETEDLFQKDEFDITEDYQGKPIQLSSTKDDILVIPKAGSTKSNIVF